jgi:hypothetical protein
MCKLREARKLSGQKRSQLTGSGCAESRASHFLCPGPGATVSNQMLLGQLHKQKQKQSLLLHLEI